MTAYLRFTKKTKQKKIAFWIYVYLNNVILQCIIGSINSVSSDAEICFYTIKIRITIIKTKLLENVASKIINFYH